MRQALDAEDMAQEIRYWSHAWLVTKLPRPTRFWNWYSRTILFMNSGPAESLIYTDSVSREWAGICFVVYSSRLRTPILMGERLPNGETTVYYMERSWGADEHVRTHLKIVREAVKVPKLYNNVRACDELYMRQLFDAGSLGQWTLNKLEGKYDGETL